MQTVCARIATMPREGQKRQMNAITMTVPCMPKGFARIATSVGTTNIRDMPKKWKNRGLRPRRLFFLERNKESASLKLPQWTLTKLQPLERTDF